MLQLRRLFSQWGVSIVTGLIVGFVFVLHKIAWAMDAQVEEHVDDFVTFKLIAVVATGLLGTGFWRWAASINRNFKDLWKVSNAHGEAIAAIKTGCAVRHGKIRGSDEELA